MKKIMFLFFCLMMILTVLPSASFAYTGGLMNGLTMNFSDGSNTSWLRSSSVTGNTNAITDNNETTSTILTTGSGNHRYAWFQFAEDASITQFKFKATGQIWLRFYNASGTLIRSIDMTNYTGGSLSNITATNAVRYVVLDENSGSTTIYEFDLFGTGGGGAYIPPDTAPPSAPIGLTAIPSDSGGTLSWIANNESDLAGYNIYQGGIKLNNTLITGTTYRVSGLSNGSTYNFTVSAADQSSNESAQSNIVSMTPLAIPHNPTNLISTSGDAQVGLTWSTVSGATYYNVLRATTSGGPYTSIANNVTLTNYTDDSIVNGTTYYYVVTAVNSSGESENSNEASATPTLPIQTRALLVITLINGLEKEFDLSMNDVNGFINWYIGRTEGMGSELYSFDKTYNLAKFISRKEYIVFSKIEKFEVNEYSVIE